MDNDVLFAVKDTKTGKIYETAWELCEDLEKELLEDNRMIFRPDTFIVEGDEGLLNILNTCDDTIYLDQDRFKIIWNPNHRHFKDYKLDKRREVISYG